MKLTSFLLLAACLTVSARGVSQMISLDMEGAPLEKVFQEIKKQSGYTFVYRDEWMKQASPVSLNLKNVSVENALDSCFRDQPLSYVIIAKTVVVKPKEEAPPIALPPPRTIKGKVLNERGSPIEGVSIQLNGTDVGTVTNSKGEFTITVPGPDAVLIVSYIGYKQQRVTIGDRHELVIHLELEVAAIDSVTVMPVNTGYQRIRPEQSTGAVSQIDTREYESRISTDFLSGLANRLPGLMINNNVQFTSTVNGEQSSRSLFNIRGISTISGNQDPLIVVDGYPTSLSLNMIDPNEIKSVTILKDAAAATIYGARASNGVIVIETKQAQPGKPRVSFRATAGFTPKENYSRYRWDSNISALDVSYQRDIYSSSLDSTSWAYLSTVGGESSKPPVYYILAQLAGKVINQAEADETFTEMGNYNNSKDYSRLFLRTAAMQTYNLDMSGGSPDALYYITVNYTGNKQEQINNSNSRILLSGRTQIRFSPRFSLTLTTYFMQENENAAPVPDISSIYPYEHFEDAYGNPLPINAGSGINPYYNATIMAQGLEDYLYYPLIEANNVNDKTHTANNRITASFDYNIGAGFSFTFGGIYESAHSTMRHYATELSSEARQYIDNYATWGDDGSVVYNIPMGGFLQQTITGNSSYTARGQLNYNRMFGKDHSITAILGAEVRDVIAQGNTASYFGYNDQTLIQQPVNYYDLSQSGGAFVNVGALDDSSLFNQQYAENRYISGFSHIVYTYRNKYSLSGSLRIDQSNLFGTDPRYRYKPLWSVGANWMLSNENFLKDVSWVDLLKLRVSDGINGNVAKNSLPQVIARSYLNTATYPSSTALSLYSLANSGLRWEQTNSVNVGIDYRIFKHIYGTIELYNKRSTDLLTNGAIDPTIGASSSIINTATINNKGMEVNLHADWIAKPAFNWNTGLVLSCNISKVLKVYQEVSGYYVNQLNSLGYMPGRSVGALFAYRYGGLDTTGYPMIMDSKGVAYTSNDSYLFQKLPDNDFIKYAGSTIPAINVGMSNRIDIGNFYFYCMLNYYGAFKVKAPRPNPSAARPLTGAGDYWKEKGDEKATDVMSLAAFASTNAGKYVYDYTDYSIVNGDYITLGDLTASYSFNNSKFFRKAGFTHFELKVQASNVWTVGLNKYNYSMATGSYVKAYLTPTYTIGLFTNF